MVTYGGGKPYWLQDYGPFLGVSLREVTRFFTGISHDLYHACMMYDALEFTRER